MGLRIQLVIPTFEPNYVDVNSDGQLLEFYRKNILSWLDYEQVLDSCEVRICLSDYRSSDEFRVFLQSLANSHEEIDVQFGRWRTSSVNALNLGLAANTNADIYAYVASDVKAASTSWVIDLVRELKENPMASIIFTTASVGASQTCDQVQKGKICRRAKKLSDIEQPIANAVFFTRNVLKPYDFRVGNKLSADLAVSLVWMAKSIESIRVMSYRLFVHHDHFINHGRFDRGSVNQAVAKNLSRRDRAAWRSSSDVFLLNQGYLPSRWHVPKVGQFWPRFTEKTRPKGVVFLPVFLRALCLTVIKEISLVTGYWYVRTQIRNLGFFNYIFQKRRSKLRTRAFLALPTQDRVNAVKTYFFENVDY